MMKAENKGVMLTRLERVPACQSAYLTSWMLTRLLRAGQLHRATICPETGMLQRGIPVPPDCVVDLPGDRLADPVRAHRIRKDWGLPADAVVLTDAVLYVE